MRVLEGKIEMYNCISTAILCHTDAAAAADVWAFLLLCGNTNPIIFVNREDVFGRRIIRHPKLQRFVQ